MAADATGDAGNASGREVQDPANPLGARFAKPHRARFLLEAHFG